MMWPILKEGDSIVSADNPLDFYDELAVLTFNLEYLNNGWNTN